MGYDPKKVRPRFDYITVLDDKRKDKLDSGIIVPVETGAEKVTEGAGTVIRIGPGEMNKALGIEIGSRIVYRSFLKYANPLETDEVWEDGTPKRYFFMSSKDIMAVIQPGVEVGVLSGRPMVPGKEQ